MSLEDKLGDDSEVASAAALEGPQQVGVGRVVDGPQLAINRHDLHSEQAVDRQSEKPARESEPSSKGDAGDPTDGQEPPGNVAPCLASSA